jgi:transcriptional regulator with XRE-family HTH domain
VADVVPGNYQGQRVFVSGLPLDLSKHFGSAVRQHRTLIRLSQEELADRAGLDRTYVSGIERGARNPTLKILQKVADALGVDLDVIFATAREIARKPADSPQGKTS